MLPDCQVVASRGWNDRRQSWEPSVW